MNSYKPMNPAPLTDDEIISMAEEAEFVYTSLDGAVFNSFIESADIRPYVLAFARKLIARVSESPTP
jgi:hypothetical protein